MRRTSVSGVVMAAVVVGSCLPLLGHAQSEQKAPAFEVVSIAARKTLEHGGSLKFQPGGRFQATNIYILALIATAFGKGRPLLPRQIEGGPDWILFDRYDVTAKLNTDGKNEVESYRRLPALLLQVLQERFNLKTHWEIRQLPVYRLTTARNDGVLGPQLKRSTCAPRAETLRTDADAAPVSRPDQQSCSVTTFGPGVIDASGLTMTSLVSTLSAGVDRVVMEGTGLNGFYDVKLQWTPDGQSDRVTDPNIPSMATALQEQLGLKLQSTRGPVEVLVIDHIEHPTPD
jgi:uncharacterized protein (TIGR03435 family)